MTGLSPHVFGRWLYSHDEDGARVYRPRDAEFAPSRRPRDGFDIEEGGRFRVYRPGPADASVGSEARWQFAGTNVLDVVDAGGAVLRTIEIVESASGMLKVRF